jgi:hypothetical protein
MRMRRGWSMPETSTYYHVAYGIALTIYALYAISLWVRRKNLR